MLDRALLSQPEELKRIWLHELFHFVWWHLGNPARRSYQTLLLAERGRGELGWSAELQRACLTPLDRATRSRKWREYCPESFCDTAAWMLTGMPRHPEVTLGARARAARSAWWRYTFKDTL